MHINVHRSGSELPTLTASTPTINSTSQSSKSKKKKKKNEICCPTKTKSSPQSSGRACPGSSSQSQGKKDSHTARTKEASNQPAQPVNSNQLTPSTHLACADKAPAQKVPQLVVDLDLTSLHSIPSPPPFNFLENEDFFDHPDGSGTTEIPAIHTSVNLEATGGSDEDTNDGAAKSIDTPFKDTNEGPTELNDFDLGPNPENNNAGVDEDTNNIEDAFKSVDRPGLPKGRKQRMLAEHLAKQCKDMELEELRKRVNKHAVYSQLIAEDKVALDAVFHEYKRQINIVAFQHLLKINSVKKYLGLASRTRIGTMYNNFCQYDPKASKIRVDSSMRIQERWLKCGALWRQLDSEEQEQFDDPAYLATLPNPLLPETTSNTPQLAGPSGTSTTNEKEKSKPCKLAKPKSFDISRWANKIFHNLSPFHTYTLESSNLADAAQYSQLTNLSIAHSIQGYLVVVYPYKKGSAMLSGGSPMGETFLDMFATDPDPCRAFLEFLKGQAALKKILGCELPLPKRTRKRKADLRPGGPGQYDKDTATGGRWRNGWPGTRTEWRLTKLGVVLRVKKNDDGITPADFCKRPADMSVGEIDLLLKAVGEGWVKIAGRSADAPDAIGDVLMDEDEERPFVKVGPVPPGGYIPTSKIQAAESTDTTKPNKRVKRNQGKSVHQTANEGHSDHTDDSNNNMVNKTSKNSNSSAGNSVNAGFKKKTSLRRPAIRSTTAHPLPAVRTTTSNKQPRNIQRQKDSKCASSEESEAEETPGESSESKDTPTESSESKDTPEESSHKGSEEDVSCHGALDRPRASLSSSPASDASSDVSLSTIKRRQRKQHHTVPK
ncbi:hypothetical protein PCANC_28164 [Puccinia coronata f. sp. avenae]|uniref:Uncharacterized protein n=1 Tax=Puccinia coronata f. sp. avenae TaxID=200324 RepID=A0A2N5TJR5_9BASI|nr:hypothetical protein PCANC_28164 [Puccinia coronata f. sp. avenae]